MKPSDAGDHLRRVYRDWKGLLANPEYDVRGTLVCWRDYHPSMLPAALTFEDVANLASNRQYSFQVAADGSVVQLVYEFNAENREVKQATLAYLQGNPSLEEDEESGIQFGAIAPTDGAATIESRESFPQWLRIDYVAAGSQCPIHANCHMHLSGFPQMRITFSNLPSPKQFIELIFAWFYPEVYRSRRLKEDGTYRDKNWMKYINRNIMPCEDKQTTSHLVHLRLPRNTFF